MFIIFIHLRSLRFLYQLLLHLPLSLHQVIQITLQFLHFASELLLLVVKHLLVQPQLQVVGIELTDLHLLAIQLLLDVLQFLLSVAALLRMDAQTLRINMHHRLGLIDHLAELTDA